MSYLVENFGATKKFGLFSKNKRQTFIYFKINLTIYERILKVLNPNKNEMIKNHRINGILHPVQLTWPIISPVSLTFPK